MKKFLALAMIALMSINVHAQVLDDGAINLNFKGRLNEAKGVNIASASTVFLDTVAGNLVHITGTTAITSFGPATQPGIRRVVVFDGVLTLTHNASTLELPGNANITTAAGDRATIMADSTSKWMVVHYTRKATAP